MARAPVTKANPYYSRRFRQWFTTEREYRNALAREKGFASWGQQQRSRRRVTSGEQLEELHPSEREARERALEALSLMRRKGRSFSEAVREAGTTHNAVFRHAGPALERRAGRIVTKRSDRLYRRMVVTSTVGVVEGEPRNAKEASLNARHANAVKRRVETGDASQLPQYQGKTVGGFELEADPQVIDQLARAGELDFLDIYELTI